MSLNKQPQPVQPTHGTTPAPFDGRVNVIPTKPGKLLRLPIVEDRTGAKKSSIYSWMKAKTFPAAYRLSARAVAWREEDIDRWISERTTAAGGAV